MNKNGTLVILNDLKKERDRIEKKYFEQKNKKVSNLENILYILGYTGVFGGACVLCPADIAACSLLLLSYGIGVPLTYSYYLFGKENKLKKQLQNIDKNIDELELDIINLCSTSCYDNEENCFVYEGDVILDSDDNLNIGSYNEKYNQDESGPSLRLK